MLRRTFSIPPLLLWEFVQSVRSRLSTPSSAEPTTNHDHFAASTQIKHKQDTNNDDPQQEEEPHLLPNRISPFSLFIKQEGARLRQTKPDSIHPSTYYAIAYWNILTDRERAAFRERANEVSSCRSQFIVRHGLHSAKRSVQDEEYRRYCAGLEGYRRLVQATTSAVKTKKEGFAVVENNQTRQDVVEEEDAKTRNEFDTLCAEDRAVCRELMRRRVSMETLSALEGLPLNTKLSTVRAICRYKSGQPIRNEDRTVLRLKRNRKLTAYNLFVREQRQEILRTRPNGVRFFAHAGELFKKLSAEDLRTLRERKVFLPIRRKTVFTAMTLFAKQLQSGTMAPVSPKELCRRFKLLSPDEKKKLHRSAILLRNEGALMRKADEKQKKRLATAAAAQDKSKTSVSSVSISSTTIPAAMKKRKHPNPGYALFLRERAKDLVETKPKTVNTFVFFSESWKGLPSEERQRFIERGKHNELYQWNSTNNSMETLTVSSNLGTKARNQQICS